MFESYLIFVRWLIDAGWFVRLQDYLESGDPSSDPGPIDNFSLFKADPFKPYDLRENLRRDVDYVLVPKEAFFMLVDRFSIAPGQTPIFRKVFF